MSDPQQQLYETCPAWTEAYIRWPEMEHLRLPYIITTDQWILWEREATGWHKKLKKLTVYLFLNVDCILAALAFVKKCQSLKHIRFYLLDVGTVPNDLHCTVEAEEITKMALSYVLEDVKMESCAERGLSALKQLSRLLTGNYRFDMCIRLGEDISERIICWPTAQRPFFELEQPIDDSE